MINLTETIVQTVVNKRPKQSHKGTFGKILIVAGDKNLGGAAIMNAQAAVYAGAGLVTVATDSVNKTAIHSRLPEAMVIDYHSDFTKLLESVDVVLIGSGLGESIDVLKKVLNKTKDEQVVILDGSALTLMASYQLPLPAGQIVLTPHQMEWQRFGEVPIADQDKEDNNWEALVSMNPEPILVLKSDQTQVYLENEVYQLTVGGPYQATGGMGDTLAGIIATFAGQFHPLGQAVLAAVYTHSAIAAELAKTNYVTLPTAIAKQLPQYMKKMAEQEPHL
ncbi:ADP-dependent (S)-NAD(P)H-hydrate dehydratase [Fructobacillus pseudoficulneus]|uniref:ADP-dependent (S)-NAD(P)H-hydrate dehydratase n=1 Tax=Fructobacillus pseudoficulneus TaxID=220714 RepID=A0A3F3GTJ8_9LACO|nr:NAD(P)H-hydrate dehydratase [Fructobacillus pseudoficulneus]GAP02775.1 ADP-dependent (S)-NAD(P)H-hydrate dehydratase [Fructobacillus pseudoficulneus]SEH39806.1 yjeF C-terminal region, hydroxyethylthiazole kinase-related [Fructobacillus pseudoficulneus]